jgi:catechol 2,3-dioxygenase-like lactoylglutathione lyase family enzyme
MTLAHLTLPTRDVERTTAFFERTFGYPRRPLPPNSPVEVQWLDIGHGQELHIFYVERFEISPFEGEFGRHVAVRWPTTDLAALRERLRTAGAELIAPVRSTSVERFFFREPVNGYVFEVIAADAESPAT